MANESSFPTYDQSFQHPSLQLLDTAKEIEVSEGNLSFLQLSDQLLMFDGTTEFPSFESERTFDKNEATIEDFAKFQDFGASCESFSQSKSVGIESENENLNFEERSNENASKVGDESNRRKLNELEKTEHHFDRNEVTIEGFGKCHECELSSERKFVYSKKEMEALRNVNLKGQKKLWKQICNGLEKTVKREYDQLASNKGQKNANRQTRNCNGQGSLGESSLEDTSCDLEITNSVHFTCGDMHIGKNDDDLVGEWSEQEESDDEYASIQRPAFRVEGEPNFESGPPEDGLEYLRRVRWEAARIPKVKVAKIDNNKLKTEQSVYMPKIPDIEKCPPHLVPSKQWEDEFIASFSELRLALSHLDDTSDTDPQTIVFSPQSQPSKPRTSLELPTGGPTLSTVLAMEPATRVSMLRKRVTLFENSSNLSKDDCAWLFALCATVDSPLDSDTCASLRCLLRVCAKLRAGKSELDDEIAMLNVLATISGKFFGQLEN